MTTSLDVSHGHYRVSVGNGNLTFSIDEHGNKSLLIPTRDLQVVTDLFQRATHEWRRAKEIETGANKPAVVSTPLTT